MRRRIAIALTAAASIDHIRKACIQQERVGAACARAAHGRLGTSEHFDGKRRRCIAMRMRLKL
eukprot:4047810-Prymnesium_polylepis.1